MNIKEEWINIINSLQDKICTALEACDGKAKFVEDKWERAEGGGGKTRVIQNGNVFEKGGVNTSVVFGQVTEAMRTQLNREGDKWWAGGISLVIHPTNPFIPTVHCNYRMFELYNEQNDLAERWFGGGADLTPFYLFDEDAKHFHQTHKGVCDQFDETFYPEFKKTCDSYFVNWHRNNERRGIGGIFYDHKKEIPKGALQISPSVRRTPDCFGGDGGTFWMNFGRACGDAFIPSYIPIVQRRKDTAYSEQNTYWQKIRRGRYVEFNLIHDRGTLFGLKTGGRTESILMSLPPTVRFEYDYEPMPGSKEDELLQVCLHPRDWI